MRTILKVCRSLLRVLWPLGVALVAFPAAASQTGSVALSGSVAISCSIGVSNIGNASTLNLTANQTNLTVATINENCNDRAGYSVVLATVNGTTTGLLKGTGTGFDTVSYTVTYGGAAVTFAAGSATVTNVSTRTGASGVNDNINITYTGNTNLFNDTYTDTLNLTLTTK